MAAFVGGLVFGTVAKADAAESVELTELAGSLLSLVLWFVFGAGFVVPAFEDLDARIVLYALGSLTVVRMLPVALALVGSGQGTARRRRSSAGSVHVAWPRWCSPCSPSRSSASADPRVETRRQHDRGDDRVQHRRPRRDGSTAGDPLRQGAVRHTSCGRSVDRPPGG